MNINKPKGVKQIRRRQQQRPRRPRQQQQQQQQQYLQDFSFNLPDGSGFIQIKIRAAAPIYTSIISETRSNWEMIVPTNGPQVPVVVNNRIGTVTTTATNSTTAMISTVGSGISNSTNTSSIEKVVIKEEPFDHPFEAFSIDNI